MRRPILVLVSSALAMMLLASGVALAKNITGTRTADNIRGTIYADNIRAGDGNDVVLASKGADVIHGDSGVDKLYGGKGNDRIFSAGRVSDVVNCGRGNRDWAEVNPSDKVEGCERVVKRGDSVAPTRRRPSSSGHLFSVGALVGIGAGGSTAPFLKDGIHKHVAEPLTGKEK